MQEAIELVNHHGMIYTIEQDAEQLQLAEISGKKNCSSLTKESLQYLQQYLDDGKSIRQAAKQEGVAEGTVRYWIKQGKLKK